MALVNMLRFCSDTGAIISDEEFWNVNFRKRTHADNLQLLFPGAIGAHDHLEVIYGGVGYPSIHHEVVRDTRRELQKLFAPELPPESKPQLVKDIARIAFEKLQGAIRRRIDQKLQFYFGFTKDDFNQGFFEEAGKRIEIKNKKIRDGVEALTSDRKADALLKAAMDSKAVVFGFDAVYGITAYHLSIENWVMGFNHEGFESIGCGKYATGLALGLDFNSKIFKARQAGYSIGEGLLELFNATILAADHFKEVGGTLNLLFLDRRGTTPGERIKELVDNPARLAMEIVRAHRAELISRELAMRLLEDMLLQKITWQEAERTVCEQVTDITALHFLLRNYKLKEIRDDIAATAQPAEISLFRSLVKGDSHDIH